MTLQQIQQVHLLVKSSIRLIIRQMFIPAQTQLMSLTLTLLLKLFMMLFQNYQQRVMIMFYYDNHGGPGVLGTPNLLRDIKAAELAESFTKAADSNLYKQYLFIIEACYSG